MIKLLQFLAVSFMCFVSALCIAAEYEKLTVDIDGDKKPEIITMSTSGSGAFQDFTIRINEATYTDKFFTVDGNFPELHIIGIDYKRTSRQLLVKTFEPSWCNFHLLSYSNNKLYTLLKFQSDGDCIGPQPLGNGTLSVRTWQGFWWKVDTYRLDPTGTQLILILNDIYNVDISVASKKDFTLEKGNCEKTQVKEGAFVRIGKFDFQKQRYLLRTSDGVCGWLKQSELDTNLSEIPYAK
jgi:hypothetical protein